MVNNELGQKIGVGPSMASRIRNGQRLPSVKVMIAIEREFGIPMDELVAAHEKGCEEFGKLFRATLSRQPTAA
jgi:transcriptional regulator with XRE-family HTH domain